ncbi:MAG: NifU family protein [Candidatus Babeliales bacterium]
MQQSLFNQVEKILNEHRSVVQADGGDFELVNIEEGKVYLRLMGSCIGCPLSLFTFKLGLERILQEHIPQITEVIMLEDQDAG